MDQLPQDVVKLIALILNKKDLNSLMRTCKQLNYILAKNKQFVLALIQRDLTSQHVIIQNLSNKSLTDLHKIYKDAHTSDHTTLSKMGYDKLLPLPISIGITHSISDILNNASRYGHLHILQKYQLLIPENNIFWKNALIKASKYNQVQIIQWIISTIKCELNYTITGIFAAEPPQFDLLKQLALIYPQYQWDWKKALSLSINCGRIDIMDWIITQTVNNVNATTYTFDWNDLLYFINYKLSNDNIISIIQWFSLKTDNLDLDYVILQIINDDNIDLFRRILYMFSTYPWDLNYLLSIAAPSEHCWNYLLQCFFDKTSPPFNYDWNWYDILCYQIQQNEPKRIKWLLRQSTDWNFQSLIDSSETVESHFGNNGISLILRKKLNQTVKQSNIHHLHLNLHHRHLNIHHLHLNIHHRHLNIHHRHLNIHHLHLNSHHVHLNIHHLHLNIHHRHLNSHHVHLNIHHRHIYINYVYF